MRQIKNEGTDNISWLIALCMQTPPNIPESNNDLDSDDGISDDTKKQSTIKTQCSNNDKVCISEPAKAISTSNSIVRHGEMVVLTMNREHSKFMNCIPLTRDGLGLDVLAKICSVV